MCYHHFYELFLILTNHLKSLPRDSCTVSQWNPYVHYNAHLNTKNSFQKHGIFGVITVYTSEKNTKSVLSLILATVSRGYRILKYTFLHFQILNKKELILNTVMLGTDCFTGNH